MAVLARGQIGLTDITDAYSVSLTLDSFTFQGDTTKVKSTQSFATQVQAMRGATAVSAVVTVVTDLTGTGLTVTDDGDSTSPTLTVQATTTLTDAILRGATLNGQIMLSVLVDGKATFYKAINLSIALTGATGAGGYSILMGNEALSITCDNGGNTVAASAITIPFSIYKGTSRVASTVTVSGLPSGITAGTNTAGTTSADGSLTLNVASGSNLGGAANGEITLTFKTGSTTVGTKKLSWSKSITGATGGTGGTGPTGPGAISVMCGNEAIPIPCTNGGLVAKAFDITIPFAGYQGTTRKACTLADPTFPSGMTKKSKTNATTSADGSLVISVAANGTLGNAATMSGEIVLTFTCEGATITKRISWAKSIKGETGDEGEDAITIVIIPSGGTVFKNSAGSKVLTAHVFKGNTELTGSAVTALGSVYWYKGAESTTKLNQSHSMTLTVQASDVNDSETYEARLEA